MKFQRSSLLLLGMALLLGGIVYGLEAHRATTPNAAQPLPQQLFSFEEAEVQQLTLRTPLKAVTGMTFTRRSPSQSPSPRPTASTQWQMTQPIATNANDGTVAYLLSLMATGVAKETLIADAAQRVEFGLEPPIATAEVKLFNQQTHRLRLGKPNFNRTGVYAELDPPNPALPAGSVVLVPIDFDNAMNRPFSEWLVASSDRVR
jgi:hypothetical protein